MNVEQKTKNLQAKKDVNILSNISNPKPSGENPSQSQPVSRKEVAVSNEESATEVQRQADRFRDYAASQR